MFENLSERIEGAFKRLKGQGRISEINIAETLKEIRRALVDADVNYKLAKQFTDDVKEKALGADVIRNVNPGQQMVKIVNDELVKLMGGTKSDININGNPAIILMAGLQGSGKTTFSAKLASYLKKKGRKPLLVACDVYRPAAIMQLKTLGEQIGVEVYSEEASKNVKDIAAHALQQAKQNGNNVLIVDTAGRLSIDEDMMNEIAGLKESIKPQEILFVVDAMTGQDAVNTAKAFNDRLNFNGVVLTKLDGDTRGGAALSIMSVVEKPIKFVGVGEKMDAIDIFYPDRMAQRILGMGDIVSLVERAQDSIDQDEAERLQKKLRKNQFDFEDFLSQLHQIKKMGNLKDLMGMIPGVNKMIKDQDINDDSLKHTEAIIQSMTPIERRNPDLVNGSRKKRIADGSGTDVQQVNQLLSQLLEMRKMMKMMNKAQAGGRMPKMPFGR
ncbi:MAG: signal recognition particle protein [Bacteroidota bacterium]|nr:signal recognition particle protein [Bacteroidota bacterium]